MKIIKGIKIPEHLRNFVIIAAVIMVVVSAWGGSSLYNYVQHDARFCTNCHIMNDAYDRWAKSAHSKTTCHACHAPDLSANLRQLWVYWTDPPDRPTHAPEIENTACYSCHRVDDEEVEHEPGNGHEVWENVLEEAGHQKHVKQERIQCVRCHSTDLHRFVAPKELCASCHKHVDLTDTGMDEHCTVCHNFTATGRENLLPTRKECLECHLEMQVDAEVFAEATNGASKDVMHWKCGECHKPHSQEYLEISACAECHLEDLAESELHAVESHDDCVTCHKPHLWKVSGAAVCQACHEDKDDEHSEGEFCGECHE